MGQCKMRSVVYETYCLTCEENKFEGCTLEEGNLKKVVKSSIEIEEKGNERESPGGERKRVTHTLEELLERSVSKSKIEKRKESDSLGGEKK